MVSTSTVEVSTHSIQGGRIATNHVPRRKLAAFIKKNWKPGFVGGFVVPGFGIYQVKRDSNGKPTGLSTVETVGGKARSVILQPDQAFPG